MRPHDLLSFTIQNTRPLHPTNTFCLPSTFISIKQLIISNPLQANSI